ncbi:TLC domain-containing protein 5 [Engraulis encrasicolus]|uniref:TLC domain-containing protein 5 n=1 Tax=Engraulis encrasicolus TaxID=184585 RepID=UPI002FD0C6A8
MALTLLEGFGCSLISWICVYALICYVNSLRGYEFNCRVVTFIHGVIIVLLTAYIAFIDGPWPYTNTGVLNTPMQILALLVSLGYFVFDMGWCMYFRTEGPVMLAHHVLTILAMLLTLAEGKCGTEACAVILGSEVTNPFLQSRWFLKRLGKYDTLVGDVVDFLFILLFLVVRIGFGAGMLHAVVTCPRSRWYIKASGLSIYTISCVFMVDIVRFAIRKSCGKYKRWQERRQLLDVANGKPHLQ